MADTRPPILSEEFMQALANAGLIENAHRIRRIVIDAQAGYVLMVYVEYHADERWLDAGLFMEGVQVHTGPPATP